MIHKASIVVLDFDNTITREHTNGCAPLKKLQKALSSTIPSQALSSL